MHHIMDEIWHAIFNRFSITGECQAFPGNHNQDISSEVPIMCMTGQKVHTFIFRFCNQLQRHYYYFIAQIRQLKLREVKQLQKQTIKWCTQGCCSGPSDPESPPCYVGTHQWSLIPQYFLLNSFLCASWSALRSWLFHRGNRYNNGLKQLSQDSGFGEEIYGRTSEVPDMRWEPSVPCSQEVCHTPRTLSNPEGVPKVTSTPLRIANA